MNIKAVKNAFAAAFGYECEIEETKPTEVNNEGVITLYLDQERLQQFACNQATCVCAPYWSDVAGSRSDALQGLIDDIAGGVEPMCDETRRECGV